MTTYEYMQWDCLLAGASQSHGGEDVNAAEDLHEQGVCLSQCHSRFVVREPRRRKRIQVEIHSNGSHGDVDFRSGGIEKSARYSCLAFTGTRRRRDAKFAQAKKKKETRAHCNLALAAVPVPHMGRPGNLGEMLGEGITSNE